MELENDAGNSALEAKLNAQLQRAVRDELREPLPKRLYAAHKRGLADYFKTAAKAALEGHRTATRTRRTRSREKLRRRTSSAKTRAGTTGA